MFEEGVEDHIRTGIPDITNKIKNSIDLDILKRKKTAWTESVGITGHPKNDLLAKQLFEIKSGL